jgi:hypothetical protein
LLQLRGTREEKGLLENEREDHSYRLSVSMELVKRFVEEKSLSLELVNGQVGKQEGICESDGVVVFFQKRMLLTSL